MGRRQVYYTLVTSLPWLPRFDRAEHLPISEKRLAERLLMLEPDDAEVVKRGIEFLEWRRHPTGRTDREMVEKYEDMMERLTAHHALQRLVEFIVDQRTIMVALRRQQRHKPAPGAEEPWGVGRWVGYIERHWDEPGLRLDHIYPWIPEANTLLENGDTLALERLLLTLQWEHIERSSQDDNFGFESVLAYLFKWSILQQWLLQDTETAKARFGDLTVEVLDDYQQLFD
jgi:hypothetical protein